MIATSDHKPKKLTPIQAQQEFEKKLLQYMEERFLNLVQQMRGLAISAGVTPEDFWKNFIDDKKQDEFYVRLHAQQDLHNSSAEEAIANNEKNQALAGLFNPSGAQNSEGGKEVKS